MKRVWAIIAAVTATLLGGSALIAATTAGAVGGGGGIALYFSPPLVQGSSVVAPQGVLETFDTLPIGAGGCLGTFPVGVISNRCHILATQEFGGASTSSDVPTVGGSGSRFPTNMYPAEGDVVLTMPTPVHYIGLWWSAGNTGNNISFYNGGTLMTTFSFNDVVNVLGTLPSPYPGTAHLTSTSGAHYLKGYYFGNPRGLSSTTPTSPSTLDRTSPYVYLNLYASGNATFDKVVLNGNGFEFDNLVTSTSPVTPPSNLVFVTSIYGKSVTFEANGGSGTMDPQTSKTTEALTSNAFTRSGYTFAGWATSPNGPVVHQNGASYDFAADVTLYAKWTPNATTTTTSGSTTTTGGQTTTTGGQTTTSINGVTTTTTGLATTGFAEKPFLLLALLAGLFGAALVAIARRNERRS